MTRRAAAASAAAAAGTCAALLLVGPAGTGAFSFAPHAGAARRAAAASGTAMAPSASGPDGAPSWSAADDWSVMSAEGAPVDTEALSGFDSDLAGEAARALEIENGSASVAALEAALIEAEDPADALVREAIDALQLNDVDPSDPPLYDGMYPRDSPAHAFEGEEAAREIGLLIRCNESPEDLLVAAGRALPPLTEEERLDPAQLVVVERGKESKQEGTYRTTAFFDLAVAQMFHEHADDEAALGATGVARWLSQSLGNELVGGYDRRVMAIISRYGTYRSGVLTEGQFHRLYVDSIVAAMGQLEHKPAKRRASWKKEVKVKQPTLESIWRDFRNHGIRPPAEEERERLQAEVDAKYGIADATSGADGSNLFDECEILEWGDTDYSAPLSHGKSGGNSDKASHTLVEMTSDGSTPKRVRDGNFVFIDEESCIGCMACANVAPGTFKMLKNGRARTFHQNEAPDVKAAVASCPVSCMHKVSYQELKKFETARDEGDGSVVEGKVATDELARAHIPLNVAGMDSDWNRRSSWYHTLRHKCYMSKQCPQKGCFDCPNYGTSGANPYFKKRHRAAERQRAADCCASGEADVYRKIAEL
jgi:ferredoxin